MLKILFKKQMMLLFANFFQKNGKTRSKMGTLAAVGGFAAIMIVVLGSMFYQLSEFLCAPLCAAGYDWFYLVMMEMIAMALGVFGSVFNTFSSLYQAKDNDLLFSLPIPVRYIMASRLLAVYAMGAMYSAVVMVPALIVYYMTTSVTVSIVLTSIIVYLMLTLLLLALSCGLGWIVAKISSKLKNKSFITVIVSVAFLAAYYFFYFKANTWMSEMLQDSAAYGNALKGKAYPLYILGKAGTGDWLNTLIVSVCMIALAVCVYFLLSHSFLKMATANVGEKAADYRKQKVKARSVNQAIMFKERKRYLSSANYMLNSSMGVLCFVALGVAVLIKSNTINDFIAGFFEGAGAMNSTVLQGFVVLAIIIAMCLLHGLNYITAPCISLEGKNIWIYKSLPIKPWDILRQKLQWHVLVSGVAGLVCSICVIVALKINVALSILLIVVPLVFCIMQAGLGLVLNLKMPNLKWTNENVVVKQSAPLFLMMLIGMVIPAGMGYSFYLLFDVISIIQIGILWGCVFAVLGLGILVWLKKKGTQIWLRL
ncbi:MAG: hypothetical protein J5972_01915 [Eubacterium sp.]|nr:hypothetical protein [Eubacterium sp.]